MERRGVVVAAGLAALAVLVWAAPRLAGGADGSLGPAPTATAVATGAPFTGLPPPVTQDPPTPDPAETSTTTAALPDTGTLTAPPDGTVWLVGSGGAGPLLAVDAATNRVVRRVPVGGSTAGIVELRGGVWVAAGGTGVLVRADVATGATRSVRAGGTAVTLTTDGRRLWTIDEDTGTVRVVDPASGKVVGSFARPGTTLELAHDGTRLWAVDDQRSDLLALDPATGRVLARVGVDAVPDRPVWDGRLLWFGDGTANRLLALDPATRRVVRTVRLGPDQAGAWTPVPTLLCTTSARVFAVTVTKGDGWAVAAVDPRTGRLLATVPLPAGTGPVASLACRGDAAWIAVGGTVLAVDPATSALVRTGGDTTDAQPAAGRTTG